MAASILGTGSVRTWLATLRVVLRPLCRFFRCLRPIGVLLQAALLHLPPSPPPPSLHTLAYSPPPAYIWNPDNLTDLYPAQTRISRNLLLNNYHSVWPLDFDDGSNSLLMTTNLLVWGGGKDYLGFNKHYLGNLYVFPEANEPTVSTAPRLGNGAGTCYGAQGTSALPAELRDVWAGETCITGLGGASGVLYDLGGCNAASPNDGNAPLVANNTFYSADGAYALKCGAETWDLPTAQSHGLDVGTTLLRTPSTSEVLALVNAFVAANLL